MSPHSISYLKVKKERFAINKRVEGEVPPVWVCLTDFCLLGDWAHGEASQILTFSFSLSLDRPLPLLLGLFIYKWNDDCCSIYQMDLIRQSDGDILVKVFQKLQNLLACSLSGIDLQEGLLHVIKVTSVILYA